MKKYIELLLVIEETTPTNILKDLLAGVVDSVQGTEGITLLEVEGYITPKEEVSDDTAEETDRID